MIPRERLSAAIVKPGSPLLEAIKAIEAGGIQAVLISEDGLRLSGMVTDGDIRRGLLRGVGLSSPVSEVMNRSPTTLRMPASFDQAQQVMNRLQIRQVPVLHGDDTLAGVFHVDMEVPALPAMADTWAVIMAGGRGTRLHPLTQSTPKPMLPIGGQPLTETIIRSLTAQGCRRIYLAVNYMAEVFKAHFGSGSQFGADIRYIEENEQLGTAGALGLLPETPPAPFIVMNGDLLTSVNFGHLLSFHREHAAMATMCVRDYRVQIPYGVVGMENGTVTEIAEKPMKTYFVNAGIYVLDPRLKNRIIEGRHMDMTQLLDGVIAEGGKVGAFPIHEYWLDIGKFDDLERAQLEFEGVFRP